MTDPKQNEGTDGGSSPAGPPRAGSLAPPPAGDSVPPAARPGPVALRGGEPVTLRATDGALLYGELLMPAGAAPRVVAALSHAMMVDRRTLDLRVRPVARPAAGARDSGLRRETVPADEPASGRSGLRGKTAPADEPAPGTGGILTELLAAGVAVLWFDQRGHGQSGPTPTQGGRWDYDDLVADAGAVAEYLRERLPGCKRVAIGHSLFGHVALAYQARAAAREAARPDPERAAALYDGLVLLAGNVWLRRLEPSWLRFLAKRASFAALLLLSWPLGYLPVRRLGIGTADESGLYLAQMGGWVRSGDWTDRAGSSYLAALASVRAPILSIAGAGDRLMAVPDCQLALVRRSSGPVTHWLVGKKQGDAVDAEHMQLVLDARLRPRWRALARWVSELGERTEPGEPARP